MPQLTTRFFIITLFLPIFTYGQEFANKLFQEYETYKEKSIQHRRFKHKNILPLLNRLESPYEVSEIGKSVEGRAIYLIKLGTGKTKVLLWSQMHGDEATATMAILDIFNFFSKKDNFQDYKNSILDNLSLYFIPMLNPDGANRFRRRTALNIDLNRDALRLQSPEGQLLKKIRDDIKADWGFNLHDQSRYYSVGLSNKTATISFLAPAYNYEKEINEIRKKAMQEIGLMNETLQQYIPGHVAKYNDDFEPRAFGDNIQKWGTSTILIESGGYKNDPEKQFIRKINFIALLTAFNQIAHKKYDNSSTVGYENIPFNKRYFHELLIRKGIIIKNGKPYIIDLAFRRDERHFKENKDFYYESYISDIGDLSTFFGYHEIDASGYTIVKGKIYPKTIKNFKQFLKLDINKLHQQGFTTVKIKKLTNEQRKNVHSIQLLAKSEIFNPSLSIDNNPSFFLEKNDKKEFIIVNGMMHKIEK